MKQDRAFILFGSASELVKIFQIYTTTTSEKDMDHKWMWRARENIINLLMGQLPHS